MPSREVGDVNKKKIEYPGIQLLRGILCIMILYIALVFCAIIYFMISMPNTDKRRIMGSLLICMGDNSYELYLFHYPILRFLVYKGLWSIWQRNFFICFTGTVIVTIFYKCTAKFYNNRKKSVT